MLSNFNHLTEATSLGGSELCSHFRFFPFFPQYFLKSIIFSPSNNFFQLGNMRHAIPCTAPFLEILTLKLN